MRCHHALALDDEGHVYAWGSNTHGELGIDSEKDSYVPVEIVSLRGKGVCQLVATGYDGDSFSLALTESGNIFSWGINSYAQLGHGDKIFRKVPTVVMGIKDVVQITAGGFHVIALKNDGTVWAWGSNSESRTGVPNTVEETSHDIRQVQALEHVRVSTVIAGGNFTYCITATDEVYSWGGSSGGANGSRALKSKPELVEDLCGKRIKKIATGYSHILALLGDGRVVIGGVNQSHQLGLLEVSSAMMPTVLQVVGNVQDISACASQSFLLW